MLWDGPSSYTRSPPDAIANGGIVIGGTCLHSTCLFFTFGTARNHNRPPLRDIQPQATPTHRHKTYYSATYDHPSPYKPAATSVAAWRKAQNGRLACRSLWATIDVVAIRRKCRDLQYVSLSYPGMVDPAVRPWPSQAGILTHERGPAAATSLLVPWDDAKWASSDSTRSALRAHDMFLNHQSTTLKLG